MEKKLHERKEWAKQQKMAEHRRKLQEQIEFKRLARRDELLNLRELANTSIGPEGVFNGAKNEKRVLEMKKVMAEQLKQIENKR